MSVRLDEPITTIEELASFLEKRLSAVPVFDDGVVRVPVMLIADDLPGGSNAVIHTETHQFLITVS